MLVSTALEFLLGSEVLGSGLSDIKNADMEGQGDGSVGNTAMSKPHVATLPLTPGLD